jgi:hypothetical protein
MSGKAKNECNECTYLGMTTHDGIHKKIPMAFYAVSFLDKIQEM